MKILRHALALAASAAAGLLILFWFAAAQASSFFDQFIDPTDGKFDTSNWLLNKKGFLPVPIIVTEPAVGYGGGAALLFFHAKRDETYLQKEKEDFRENKGGKITRPRSPPCRVISTSTVTSTWTTICRS